MSRLTTANTDERNTKNIDLPDLCTAIAAKGFLTSVMTVHNLGKSEILKGNTRFRGILRTWDCQYCQKKDRNFFRQYWQYLIWTFAEKLICSWRRTDKTAKRKKEIVLGVKCSPSERIVSRNDRGFFITYLKYKEKIK